MSEEQKALAPLQQAGNLMSGSQFQQMLAVSEFLAKSDLIPEHFRGKAANVFVALEMALRQNMSVFPIMQNMYVVYGRPGIEAKLTIAMINASGKFDQELDYLVVEKEGRIVSCIAWTMKGDRRVEGPAVTAEMVKAEKWDEDKQKKDQSGKPYGPITRSKWNTIPSLMYRYRAATFFARVKCPEVLMGLQTVEEIEDVVELAQVPGPNGGGDFFGVPATEEQVNEGVDIFATMVQSRELSSEQVDKFVEHCAKTYAKTAEEIKARATENPDNFFGAFQVWAEKGKSEEKKERKTRSDKGTTKPAFTSSCLQHGNFEGDECPDCEKIVKASKPQGEAKDPGPTNAPNQGNGDKGRPGWPYKLVNPETQEEILALCKELGVDPDREAARWSENKTPKMIELYQEDAMKMLNSLLDKKAALAQ